MLKYITYIYVHKKVIIDIGDYMEDKLMIYKKDKLKGEDGFKVFSVRMKEETVAVLDSISANTNRSRNEIINILLDFAIERCEISEQD